MAKAWLSDGPTDTAALANTAAKWSTQEWIHFIDSLPRKMPAGKLASLDHQFNLTTTRNAEVAHVWYRLAIANHYTEAFGAMGQYMIRIGRRKLILPLYRHLAATSEGLALAKKIYATARPGYHPLTQDSVDAVLKK